MAASSSVRASSFDGRFGANPPSSPSAVARPRSFSSALSAWYVSTPQRRPLGEARRTDRREHELLDVDVGVGVRAAVEHVHERHRAARGRSRRRRSGRAGARPRRPAALADRERHAEDGVGAEAPLAVGAVERRELVVEQALVGAVEPHDRVGDLAVHVVDRGAHALAAVALAAVAQLVRLVRAGAGAARDDRPSLRAREQLDVDLDGRVPPGIEDLTAHDLHDRAHLLRIPW